MEKGKVTRSKFKKSASMGRVYFEGKRNTIRKPLKAIRSVEKQTIRLTVNGQLHEMEIGNKPGEIKSSDTLAYTLRETLGLTGTKVSWQRRPRKRSKGDPSTGRQQLRQQSRQ